MNSLVKAISLVAVGIIVGGAAGAAIDHAVVGQPTSGLSTPTTAPRSTTTQATESSTTTTTTTTPPPVTYRGSISVLPVSDSAVLSVPQSDPDTVSVIQPTSCTITGGIVTATGTVGFVSESYRRAGDVIELYVWGGQPANPVQLVNLPVETPAQLTSPWRITAPLDPALLGELDASSYCNVALQSTHAFMYAGSAGG
jgi:hypothetical protein